MQMPVESVNTTFNWEQIRVGGHTLSPIWLASPAPLNLSRPITKTEVINAAVRLKQNNAIEAVKLEIALPNRLHKLNSPVAKLHTMKKMEMR